MNCPFCKHKLEIKQTHGGLYGKCHFCRFCGYLPQETLQEVSKDTSETLPKEMPQETLQEVSKETPETLQCPVCDKSYKTEEGFKRHLQRVSDEEEIHPTIFKRHNKYFSEVGT